ncbi:hypothetical protein [Synechocystis sp. PCC 7509]|uniref:hypothetical protein n=1 Tax=Synechocystis sp. PCC 7509 TaxID=927677 RepID=UPI0002ACD4B7|nr:hypothetical protein [Synechocystis sp. PCC 7509]
MLVPLTRQKFEQVIPRIASAEQYKYYWGKSADFLRRLLFSVVGVLVVLVLEFILGRSFGAVLFCVGLVCGLYWFWEPVYRAGLRNQKYRRYPYAGFFRGRILDIFLTEELISTEENVNEVGEFVLIENRERRLNLEVGDESGFMTTVQVPLRKEHKVIAKNQTVEMVLLSNSPDLSDIDEVTDLYIPSRKLWVSDYPCLQRDMFVDVSRRLGGDDSGEVRPKKKKPRSPSKRRYID